MCAVIMASTLWAMAARKGTSSSDSIRSLGWSSFGNLHVAVLRGVAVSREMLGSDQNIIRRILMRAFDEGRYTFCHSMRIFAKGPGVDDGIIRIVVYVRIGSKHPMIPSARASSRRRRVRVAARRSDRALRLAMK